MNLRGVLYLGLRYLVRHRTKTLLLISAFTLAMGLPLAISRVVEHVETQLRSRALETELVLGQAGSALELTFNALYFTKPDIASAAYGEAMDVNDTGMAQAIPLYARFSAGGYRIVGTNLDYFLFREFRYADGRAILHLGECVVGAAVAEDNQIEVGDSVVSSPESLFDLAGVYPLKMRVAGILEPMGSPDDRAIFVDLKTTWIIEGLGHGHQQAAEVPSEQRLSDDGGSVRLNASVVEYNEITEENRNSFHFHGDEGDLPVTSILVLPFNDKGQALLKGRYTNSQDRQLVTPRDEMDELFDTVFSIQKLVLGLLIAIGLATAVLGLIVFILSGRLRSSEFSHLQNLGASPGTLRALIGFEAGFVLIASLLATGVVLILVDWIAPIVILRAL